MFAKNIVCFINIVPTLAMIYDRKLYNYQI